MERIKFPKPDVYLSDNYIVLDFETTSLESGSALNPNNILVLACWYDAKTGERYYKFGSEFEQQELVSRVLTADFVVAHNAKFELQWLKRCGVNLRKVLPCCTLLGEWVIHGNIKVPLNLEAVGKRRGLGGKEDRVSKLIAVGVDVREIPKKWLRDYCFRDVELTHDLFHLQRDELIDREQMHIWVTRNTTCAVLADIEFNGMTLDERRVNEEFEKLTQQSLISMRELERFAGGINFNSPKQVAEFVYDKLGFKELKGYKGEPLRTNTGNRKAGSDVITRLEAETDEQRRFQELYVAYRDASQLLSKNVNFFKAVCDENEGHFNALLNQGRTANHRLASNGRPFIDSRGIKFTVQFQNLPRQYKRLFKANRKNHLIAESDASGLEFRVGTDLGQDRVALGEIEDGADIHAVTASTMTAAGEPISRQDAKAYTFRPLYGGEAGSPAQKEYNKFFNLKYYGIYKTQMSWVSEVVTKKKLRTPYGMEFYWPEAKVVNKYSGRVNVKTQVFNYPVSNFATGEIVPIALYCFWIRIEDRDIEILNTIHDSIVSDIDPKEREAFEEIATRAFTTDVYEVLEENYNYKFRVPLGVGMKVATHWGDTKEELQRNVWPDGRIKEIRKNG